RDAQARARPPDRGPRDAHSLSRDDHCAPADLAHVGHPESYPAALGPLGGGPRLVRRTGRAHNATRESIFERQRTSNGAPIDMTLGWHVGRLRSAEYFYKEGGGGGFHCMMRLYRSHGLATLVMVNATGFDVSAGLDALDAEFVS